MGFWRTLFSRSLPLVLLLGGVALAGSGCVSDKTVPSDSKLVQAPVLQEQSSRDDFAFPARPPRLSRGKAVFEQNCLVCHRAGSLKYEQFKAIRPIDTYLLLSRGDNGHPGFQKLTRDQRWEAVFYTRYLAGAGVTPSEIKTKQLDALFGSNCAVCHGAKGLADGPLHSGHASAHELGMAPVKGAFDPPPADFHNAARMFNRTDDLLVKHIAEGVYPSGMPSWLGREDRDKKITFTEPVIRDLVRYLRTFSYEHDLDDAGNPIVPKPDTAKNSPEMSFRPVREKAL